MLLQRNGQLWHEPNEQNEDFEMEPMKPFELVYALIEHYKRLYNALNYLNSETALADLVILR